MSKARALYFLDRGHERPESHRAPFYRYLIFTEERRADFHMEDSTLPGNLWYRSTAEVSGEGFLLLRWQGLIVNYKGLVRGGDLIGGGRMGFSHPHNGREPWSLLSKAAWFSKHEIPRWLLDAGVTDVDPWHNDYLTRNMAMHSVSPTRLAAPDKPEYALAFAVIRGDMTAAKVLADMVIGDEIEGRPPPLSASERMRLKREAEPSLFAAK